MRLRAVLALSLGCLMGFLLAVPPRAEEPDAARLAAAKDLLEATGTAKQMDGMIAAMAKGFEQGAAGTGQPEAAKAATREFGDYMKRFSAYREQMITDFAALYAERFTAEELKAIADFYRNGPGAKFIAAMPELMQAGAQIGMKYSQKVLEETENARKGQNKP